MLFNSYEFIFLFLPVTLLVFTVLMARDKSTLATLWLVASSLFFYGWWAPSYLLLLLISIGFNFGLGRVLAASQDLNRKALLLIGLTFNLGLLAYYKYANFLAANVNQIFGTGLEFGSIILPLAISFYTFQQIAYLIDTYRGEATEPKFLQYCLFITFFPQLIAGPIVHHKEMMPQFLLRGRQLIRNSSLVIGLTIFFIGLFKKIIIADQVAVYSTPVFDAAASGTILTFFEAWGAVFAYTLQLYFDFSGYSDMALGIARMFGIRLPVNFFSPYKAVNIIDFWRRWHITLSRFLRDYLYIPLGGNRKGNSRRYANLVITMLLGGLWHGAGWNFVLWGGLHGFYLLVNHAWLGFKQRLGFSSTGGNEWPGRILTFLAVAIAWVPFRASDISVTMAFYEAMLGLNGFVLPEAVQVNLGLLAQYLHGLGWEFRETPYLWRLNELTVLILLMGIVWFAPNTLQLMRRYRPALIRSDLRSLMRQGRIVWRPTVGWSLAVSSLAVWAILNMGTLSEFLYFQF